MAVEPTPAIVGAMYDCYSKIFADMLGGYIHLGYWEDPNKHETPEVVADRMTLKVGERLSPARGQRILDVGCGTGKTTMQIATTYDVHVTGITVSHHQIELAQAKYKSGENSGEVRFEFANAMELPYPDVSFDGAYAIESFLHMNDRLKAMQHISRVLRPGSRLIIADLYLDRPCPESKAMALYYEMFKLVTLPTGDDLQNFLQLAGFKVLDFTDIRANILPSTKLLAESGKSVGGEEGQKFLELASGLEELKELGYALITAERI
ncbi:unnamed protein product [Penicillium olsonii]|nr:unnamed protein product [Penicillium olsonii]CAG7923400.1 unnamed protein product [Penicillium olsonii]